MESAKIVVVVDIITGEMLVCNKVTRIEGCARHG